MLGRSIEIAMKEVEMNKQGHRCLALLGHQDLNALQLVKQRKITKLKADFKVVQSKVKTSDYLSALKMDAKTTLELNPKLRGIDVSALRKHFWQAKDKYRTQTVSFNIRQPTITPLMRMTLFNWLLEVSSTFKLSSRTIFLCGNIFDRYTQLVPAHPKALQLLGLVCLYIASKFEDIHPPQASDLCLLVDNIFVTSQIVDLESKILIALKYELVFVSPLDIVELNMTELGCDKKTRDLALLALQALLIQGAISVFDAFVLAAFACDFAFKMGFGVGQANYEWNISQRDAEMLGNCYTEALATARRHQLSWINRRLSSLGMSSSF